MYLPDTWSFIKFFFQQLLPWITVLIWLPFENGTQLLKISLDFSHNPKVAAVAIHFNIQFLQPQS